MTDSNGPIEKRSMELKVSAAGVSAKAKYTNPYEAVAVEQAKRGDHDAAVATLNAKPPLFKSLFGLVKGGRGADD